MNNKRIVNCELRIKNGEFSIIDGGGRISAKPYSAFRIPQAVLIGLFALLLTACGGGPPAQPTAIPASVARPDQPSPELVRSQPAFGNINSSPTVIITPENEEAAAAQSEPEVIGTPTPIQLLFKLPPSALGIATGGTTIVDTPNGNVLATLPAGSTLTVSGRSADGKFLAVYDDNGISGWVPVGAMKLFGADDLTVVDEPVSPAPIVTLMAEAMLPPATSALQEAMRDMMETTPVSVSTPTP